MGKPQKRERIVAVDTGGTFTDFVLLDPQPASDGKGVWRIRSAKILSTPDDPTRAIFAGLRALGVDREVVLLHGSTVGLNALLTGTQGRVALVTNKGFEDLLELGRQTRPQLFALHVGPREVLVPRELRLGVPEHRLPDGRLLGRQSKEDTHALHAKIKELRPEAIAICLLTSYVFPEDEARLAEELAPLGLPITCSSNLLRRHREFERFQAAVANASLIPVMRPYLESLSTKVQGDTVFLARNEGGLTPLSEALERPISVVLSGPAGGAAAARAWARACGYEMALGFDMGGTSADVALCGDTTDLEDETQVGPYTLALPSVPLTTVGCGGGSILYLDEGGALRVGPESAGADPGPACYGRGDQPTLTDAHLLLGRLPESLVGGSLPLDKSRAEKAIQELANRLGTTSRATCEAALEIADHQMARPLRRFSVGRGLDPATLVLVAFGGAGGLHACRLADLLGIPTVLVPHRAGVLSAEGMLMMPEVRERDEAISLVLDGENENRVLARAKELLQELLGQAQGGSPEETQGQAYASLRYLGSDRELWVPGQPGLREAFQERFRARFGFTQDLEVECLRVRARVEVFPSQRRDGVEKLLEDAHPFPAIGSTLEERSKEGGKDFRRLEEIGPSPNQGPFIILAENTTVVVEEDWQAHRHRNGCLILKRNPHSPATLSIPSREGPSP